MTEASFETKPVIDTHVHLDMIEKKTSLSEVLQRADNASVSAMFTIGCGVESTQRSIEIAEEHPHIFVISGIHPHSASAFQEQEWQPLVDFLEHPKVIGVGETGLDFYYDFSTPEDQEKWFRRSLQLAIERNLPFAIHSRDAEEKTLQILREEGQGQQLKGIIHCFSHSRKFAEACLEMGLYLSIPGIVTFAKSVQKVVKRLPLERLLIETDGPFLAPVPHRGKQNEPAFVQHTAAKVASLLGCSYEEVARETTKNAKQLFALTSLD